MGYNAELAILPGTEQRTMPRRIVNFAAVVRDSGATARDVQISDLSPGGCRITASQLEKGAEILLKISGLNAIRARVVWTNNDEAGCEFFTPLDLPMIDELVAKRPPRKVLFGPAAGSERPTGFRRN